ncbi:hypothetical protein BY458DRAFT_550070 [Sporodiniella umbellata]|nr:hypothetical protein BY458DRAFT_550070 [Sporodiniella umbellata]
MTGETVDHIPLCDSRRQTLEKGPKTGLIGLIEITKSSDLLQALRYTFVLNRLRFRLSSVDRPKHLKNRRAPRKLLARAKIVIYGSVVILIGVSRNIKPEKPTIFFAIVFKPFSGVPRTYTTFKCELLSLSRVF